MASPQTITLNGNAYAIAGQIRRYRIPRQIEGQRSTSGFQRVNYPKLEPYVFNSWRRGFGTRYVRPGFPEDKEGFYDTSLLTMWPHHITLPIDLTDLTDVTDAHGTIVSIVGSAIFNGRLWALMRPGDVNTGAVEVVLARNLSGSTWGGGGNVLAESTNSDKIQGYDMIVAEAKLYAVMGGVTAAGPTYGHLLRYSSDGITWTAPATTVPTISLYGGGAGTETTMLNDQARGARLAYDGVNVVLAVHDTTTAAIRVFKSVDGGDTWASVLTRNIQSSGGPTGLKAYLHTDGTLVIYLATAEGLYLIDIPSSGTISAQQLLVFSGNANNGMRMEVHQGSLYIPIDNGNNSPFGMKKLTVIGDQRRWEDVGLDVTQGIVDTLLGPVRWMVSRGPFLFAAVGGAAASRQASILSLTGNEGDGWQHVYRHSTANDPFTWVDFNGVDMIFSRGGETAAGATDPGDTIRVINLLIPTAGTSGIHTFAVGDPNDLQLPDFGGDASAEPGAFFIAQIEGLSLADGAEFIDVEWGLNGADPSAPSTDVRLNNTTRSAPLAAAGISGRTIRINLEFNASSGKSPRLREFVLLFRKKPVPLWGFVITLDLEATEKLIDVRRGYEKLLEELDTIDALTTLVPLEIAQGETYQVELVNPSFGEVVAGRQGQSEYAGRKGTATITLEEMMG